MKHLLLTTIAAVVLVGCATNQVGKIDRLAAMYETSRLEQDVVYYSVDGMDLRLDIFVPDNRLGEPPWWEADDRGAKPTIIYIHGGGWVGGAKEDATLILLPFIARDWVVISVDYRLAKDGKAPAAVEDSLAALDWVHNNARKYQIDTNRIILAGDSAGGQLALLTGMLKKGDQLCGDKLRVEKSNRVAAIISWVGVTDFALHYIPEEWFDTRDNLDDVIRSLSPVNYVRKNGPPVITIQGSDDPVVRPIQAKSLHKKLRMAGVKEKLVMIPGKKHGNFSPAENTFIYSEIWKFLESAGIKTIVD